jgi:hypothetical protein
MKQWKVDGVDFLRVITLKYLLTLVADSLDDSVLVELIFTHLSNKFLVL